MDRLAGLFLREAQASLGQWAPWGQAEEGPADAKRRAIAIIIIFLLAAIDQAFHA